MPKTLEDCGGFKPPKLLPKSAGGKDAKKATTPKKKATPKKKK